jgi:hypothetical protein
MRFNRTTVARQVLGVVAFSAIVRLGVAGATMQTMVSPLPAARVDMAKAAPFDAFLRGNLDSLTGQLPEFARIPSTVAPQENSDWP